MDDTISRKAAIDAVTDELDMIDHVPQWVFDRLEKRLKQLPSTQTEITDEQAIEHLQSTGWMQNHDREMYYMGLKEQLADDSGSYDSLLPSAQPEIIRCKDCKYYASEGMYCAWNILSQSDHFYCYYAERREE